MKKTAALLLLLACGAAQAAPYGAGFYDTSEYLAGKVAVNIIFVESDGSIDARTETTGWTVGKKSSVVTGIQNAMTWWATRSAAANLSFVYNSATVTTGYEPISRTSDDEGLWVNQVMGKLGYGEADYFDRVFHYNNDRRDAAGTDWSFTFFVVDSQNDADGMFADGFFAYAYIGGPFSIMTYDNDSYGIGDMPSVAAHETGHIFYALDEYADSNCTRAQVAGYLNGANSNCENGGASVECIMRGDVWPYYTPAVCAHTAKQLGWSDANSNGELDLLDYPPNTALGVYSPDPTTNTSPVYYGAAHSTGAYTNSNTYAFWGSPRTPNNIGIGRVASVEYKVDAGAWQAATASDGAFGGSAEDYSFTAASLGSGGHTMQVRALNTFGAYDATPASDSLTVNIGQAEDIPYINDGTGPDVDYARSKSSFSANWGASYHSSGISYYQYALGTTPGASDKIAWTSAGTAQTVTRTGISPGLIEGQSYYVSVRAYPVSGTVSGTSTSDGFRVDTTSPTAKVLLLSANPAGTGALSAKLIVTEAGAVSGTPQLAFKTSTGVSVPMTTAFLVDSTWTASGFVESSQSTGAAVFQFSGFDDAGNAGTYIVSGGTVTINYALTGGSSGTVSNSDGTSVTVPIGAYTGTLLVSISTVPAAAVSNADSASPDSRKIYAEDLAREFSARDGTGVPVTSFASPVTITMAYPDADGDGRIDGDLLREATAWIYYLDPSAGKWTPVPGVRRDAAANTVSAEVEHFSVYSVRSAGVGEGGLGSLKAYPNPCDFRTAASLTIEGAPSDATDARVYIYNEAGELVRTLAPGDGINGLNVASWDGRQKGGARAASGLYIYLFKTANYGKGSGKFFIVW
ncbi:MAG TPA: hypothetical protein DEQ38_09700 [Elusimicrobia bacterium]|nr:MAG: hypothetical protein A2089_04135 [Elusimicrobia bacterium GWD2_63_28]HCC48370.1 hypothetical protein [Elusimicrobiota bacterium]